MKKVKFIILFSIFGFKISAQELSTNPTSIKWSKVSTPHFKVIFPNGIDSVARNTALTLESNYLPISNSLGVKPRPISLILQNQTTESNGFVTITPRRSEFFMNPPQDYTLLGTNNWLDLLSAHEYRHIVQYDKALTGSSKLFHTLFGNYGLSGLSHLVLPDWFWEGDAVGIETAHTKSGRGKIPSFSMLIRAQLLTNDRPFSYFKSTGRSFKDFVPNHYVYGYFLTSFFKEKYGYNVFDKVLKNEYNFPFYPFSFSNNIKKISGKSIDNTYLQTMAELKTQLKNEAENRKLYQDSYVNIIKPKHYTDYENPQYLENGDILALKSGLDHIAQFVVLDKSGKENKLHELGYLNDALTLSVVGNKVVWAEFLPDVRWAMRDYSIIKVLNINTGKIASFSSKTKLAAPALDPEGRQIVAINTDQKGRNTIQILNAETFFVVKEFSFAENAFFQHPSWAIDGKSIVVVETLNGKKSIKQIDVESGKIIELIPFSNSNYAHPILNGDLLLYNNSLNGIDNVYALNINSKQYYQVTNAKFGAFNGMLSKSKSKIIFTDFTSLGHRVAEMPFDIAQLIPIDSEINNQPILFGGWMPEEAKSKMASPLEQSNNLEVTPYSKWNIFNINSWGIVASGTDGSLNLGVDTQDILSTTTASVGYGYNPNEKQSNYYANISYEGFFPIFDLTFSNTGRQTIIPKGSIKDQPADLIDNWRQQAVDFGVKLPFTFRKNKYSQYLTIGSTYSNIFGLNYNLPGRYQTQIANKTIQSLTNNISYSRSIKTAKRDVGPRWAQSLVIYNRNTPFGNGLQGSYFGLQGSLNVPGFQKHDLFRLKAGLMQNGSNYILNNTDNTYFFSSPLSFPRGYTYEIFDKMFTTSVDYKTPIADPDFAIGRLLYFQRIKAGLFYDYGIGKYVDNDGNSQTINYNSMGLDLSTIMNIMRFSTPIELGVRFNYSPDFKNKFIITPLILDIPF